MLREAVLVILVLGGAPRLVAADAGGAVAPATQPAAPVAVRAQMALPGEPAPTSAPRPPQLPLAGYSDGVAYLRSPDGTFVLLPNARLQVDGYFFRNPIASSPYKDTFLVKRARIELFGWIGPRFGYCIAGDFAAAIPAAADPVTQSAQSATDDYVLVAPFASRWRDALIFQLGQFDAPFTLENRTSDKYFDLIERSITVRAFGIPTNKELGVMVHGLLPNQLAYYSVGVFNGDGQNFKNLDNRFDVMGRAWIAPFALGRSTPLDHVTLGGSVWAGDRKDAMPLASQTTAAGFKFLDPKWTSPIDGKTPLELHQNKNLRAFAVELDAPIAHKCGVRLEWVYKNQDLFEYDVTNAASGKITQVGSGRLKGWSLYAQAWAWIIGDDTIVGRPGLQLPPRVERFGVQGPRHGLQVLARIERLEEEITSDTAANGDPLVGHINVTSLQLGLTYWYTKRFRVMFNYGLNMFAGNSSPGTPTPYIVTVWSKLDANFAKHWEHEFLLRAAVAL